MNKNSSSAEKDTEELWRQPAPGKASNEDSIQDDLDSVGWSKVVIPGISQEPIIIAYSKNQPGIPAGYAVYTTAELERIGKIKSPRTIRLIHAAIKMGAELITQ